MSQERDYVFTPGFVRCVGDVLGMVVADTHRQAREAAKHIKIIYDDDNNNNSPIPSSPPVYSINEAIEHNSFFKYDHVIQRTESEPLTQNISEITCAENEGQGEGSEKEFEVSMSGELDIGGQEHFYLEPHAVLVVPGEVRLSLRAIRAIRAISSCGAGEATRVTLRRLSTTALNKP